MAFETRRMAGGSLAARLRAYAKTDAVVVGLTRGGVVVGHEVAEVLHLPCDILVIHKLVAPGQQPVGVIAEPDHLVVHELRVSALGLPPDWLEEATAHGLVDVRRRATAYRRSRERQALTGRSVIVVDDSASTGATLHAAVQAIQALEPREIVVAVPVAPLPIIAALRSYVSRVVYLATPADLIWDDVDYPRPGEITDDEIRRLLEQREPALAGAAVKR